MILIKLKTKIFNSYLKKNKLKLSEELILISAINGKIKLNTYLQKKIEPKILALIDNETEGYIQELAKNASTVLIKCFSPSLRD